MNVQVGVQIFRTFMIYLLVPYASEEENRTRNRNKNESVSGPLYVY